LGEALDEGLARRLILVCAPAGFGKTALLAHWARSGDRPVAWLSLDAADNDPARFLRHAVAALGRAPPGVRERAAQLGRPAVTPARCSPARLVSRRRVRGDDQSRGGGDRWV